MLKIYSLVVVTLIKMKVQVFQLNPLPLVYILRKSFNESRNKLNIIGRAKSPEIHHHFSCDFFITHSRRRGCGWWNNNPPHSRQVASHLFRKSTSSHSSCPQIMHYLNVCFAFEVWQGIVTVGALYKWHSKFSIGFPGNLD